MLLREAFFSFIFVFSEAESIGADNIGNKLIFCIEQFIGMHKFLNLEGCDLRRLQLT